MELTDVMKKNKYIKPLRIGNLEIDNNLIFAPLAGYSDSPYRQICKKYGCGLSFTEMISASGIIHQSRNTQNLLAYKSPEKPLGVQLFGKDPEEFARAAEMLREKNFDLIDINCGCSVRKVFRNGSGSALMKDPEKVYSIVRGIKEVSGLPVSVKTRLGIRRGTPAFKEVVDAVSSAGGSMVTIHGRYKDDLFKNNIDLENLISACGYIKKMGMTAIANGDINNSEDGYHILKETGADGIMIGRGALGSPWIFANILENSRAFRNPMNESRNNRNLTDSIITEYLKTLIAAILEHQKLQKIFYGEKYGIILMRKHITHYLQSFPNAKNFRQTIFKCETFWEVEKALAGYREFIY